MNIEHVAAPLGEIHIPYNWEFADAAEREAAAITNPDMVGHLARQLSDDTLWLLRSVAPVTWQSVAAEAHLAVQDEGTPLTAMARTLNFAGPNVQATVAGQIVTITILGTDISGKQDADQDLTDIAALVPADGDVIQRVSGAWLNRSMAQLKASLGLTKADVGLPNVDDTPDANKPVSGPQADADTATLNSAKAYADSLVTTLWDDRGNYDASGNTFPTSADNGSGPAGAVLKNDIWNISVPGVLGGVPVAARQTVRALVDAPGQTASNWAIGLANTDIDDAINDGVTGRAPSQNAVFDALAQKAPLASPALTGTPTAPNPAAGTYTAQLQTTKGTIDQLQSIGWNHTGAGPLMSNIDDATVVSGIYYINGTTTGTLPVAANNGNVIHKVTGTVGLQILQVANATKLYWRYRASSTWQSWHELANTDSPTITGTVTTDQLAFAGTARRITGDMSNAAQGSRLAFQTSTANSTTTLNILPSGSGTSANLCVHAANDAANAPRLLFGVNSTEAYVQADQTGTGVAKPLRFRAGGNDRMTIQTDGVVSPGADNGQDFGTASLRWKVIYAATGTINTSDAREKTPVRALTAAEIAAASELADAIGSYQWLESIQYKAGAAREHIGLTVQQAIAIMEGHGLDPMRYGFICHDQWNAVVEEREDPQGTIVRTREQAVVRTVVAEQLAIEVVGGVPRQVMTRQEVDVPVTVDRPVLALDGTPLTEWVPAVLDDAGIELAPGYARPVTHPVPVMETVEQRFSLVETQAAGDRYAFRYDQLCLFITAGQQARLAALAAALAAITP